MKRLLATVVLVALTLLGGIIGGSITNIAWLTRTENTGQPNASFELALADPLTGNGSAFIPSASYGSCTDPGGGVCLNSNGGIQLANPFAITPVFGVTPAGGNNAMSAAFSGVPQLTQGVATTVASNIAAGTSVVITPASMNGIFVGQALLLDTNTASVESIVVSAVTSTTFTAQAVANAHTCSCTLKAGPSFNMSSVGPGGGFELTVPAGYQGSVNDPAGILEIAVPTEASGLTNVPYDIALLGSQGAQVGKAQHQIFVSSNSASQDDLMFLYGPSSQLTLNNNSVKCLTLNSGTAGTTTTPSFFIVKCNGEVTAFGNITANNTANGQGELLSGNAGVIGGPLGTGDVSMGAGGGLMEDAPCGAVGAEFVVPNAGATTMPSGGDSGCGIKTNTANTASQFVLNFPQTFHTSPRCFEEDGTVTANLTSRCTTSTTAATVTFFLGSTGAQTAPGNSQTFYLFFEGGK